MREIKIDDVREGDVARSNGKELRVVRVFPVGRLIQCEGDGGYTFVWTPEVLEMLGVTFWREERELPDYPGAIVTSRDGLRLAVRACDRGEVFAPWLIAGRGYEWRTDPELLDWLGPDWQETTTPPASEWMPVGADQIREGDFVRFEWPSGDAVEGVVTVGERYIEFVVFEYSVVPDDCGQWFKREARTT